MPKDNKDLFAPPTAEELALFALPTKEELAGLKVDVPGAPKEAPKSFRERVVAPIEAGLFKAAETGTFGATTPILGAVRGFEKGIGAEAGRREIAELSKQIEKDYPTASLVGEAAGFIPGTAAGLFGKIIKLGGKAPKLAKPVLRAFGIGAEVAGTEFGRETVGQQADIGEAADDIARNLFMGAAASIGGEAGGAVAKQGLKYAGKGGAALLGTLRGISPKSIEVFANNPKAVSAAIAETMDQVFIPQVIDDVTGAVRKFVVDRKGMVDKIINESTELVDLAPVVNAAKAELGKIGDVVVGASAKSAKSRVGKLLDDLSKVEGPVSAQQLNNIKKQLQEELQAFYNQTRLKGDMRSEALSRIESVARETLEKVDPRIKAINAELSEAAKIGQKLGFGDAFKYDGIVDQNRMQNLLGTLGNINKLDQIKAVRNLDKLIGTNLEETASIFRSARDLMSGDWLSGFKTGRSVLGPMLGYGVGGPWGVALGTALQAPAMTRPVIRGATGAGRAIQPAAGLAGRLIESAPVRRGAAITLGGD